jgi:hypothetical protein
MEMQAASQGKDAKDEKDTKDHGLSVVLDVLWVL